ncbi:MAG: methyltransferase domain-containing protein [Pseudomonadota bacterium]
MTSDRTPNLARAHVMHAGGGGHEFLMKEAVTELMDRLSLIKRTFGDGLGAYGLSNDLPDAMQTSAQVERVATASGLPGDDLQLAPQSFDLVLAPLTLHWASDLPGALVQLRRALRPDGLLLAVLPGPDTLTELRQSLLAAESEITGGAAQRVDAFMSLNDAGGLLQRAGFALPVVDRDVLTVRYGSFESLAKDLRGWAGTRRGGPPLSRAVAERATDIYRERFSDADGKLRASIEFISMQAWVPHESQQKPLARGSAKMSLAAALKPSAN